MVDKRIQRFFDKRSLSLSRFIHLCLYDKSLGFYQKNKINTHFTTAPEVSQVFGECLGIFMLNISNSTGISSFLELGPGNGTLMSDVIRTISSLSKEEFEFYLYEKSRYLRYIQSHKLKSQMSSKSKIETLKNLKLLQEKKLIKIDQI